MKKAIKIFIITILLLVGSSSFVLAKCDDPSQTELEIKLPGLEGCVNGPADYLSGIYKLSLGVGVFLAAVVIVRAGIKYAISGDNATKQKDAKDDIFQAIFGLVVLFGSVIILRTINPDLTDLGKLQKLPSISPMVTSDAALSEDCKEFMQDRADCLKECTNNGQAGPKIFARCTEICNMPPAVDPCSVQENGGGSGGAE
jgi:hypothetical protein